jgi:hypothetical protein
VTALPGRSGLPTNFYPVETPYGSFMLEPRERNRFWIGTVGDQLLIINDIAYEIRGWFGWRAGPGSSALGTIDWTSGGLIHRRDPVEHRKTDWARTRPTPRAQLLGYNAVHDALTRYLRDHPERLDEAAYMGWLTSLSRIRADVCRYRNDLRHAAREHRYLLANKPTWPTSAATQEPDYDTIARLMTHA